MGKQQSKPEEVIIAQTASGGNNDASASQKEVAFHLTTLNVILTTILTMLGIAMLYGAYHIFKRCHQKTVRNDIARYNATFRRSFGFARGLEKETYPLAAHHTTSLYLPPDDRVFVIRMTATVCEG
ncbi:unnamed protein product [Arctia plantaginis]|uniref:Uncharacterized protein n=1 Tax=Arctia plantaginis TaxID=874455 RepID=A0A8S1B3C3_ARCPL|nr:unnamed protein product [Arctia plantaginis]